MMKRSPQGRKGDLYDVRALQETGKQKIAEGFAVSEGLEAFDLEPDDNACPQSFQPVTNAGSGA